MGSDVIFLSLSRSLFLWFYVRYDLKEKDTHYTNVQLGLQLTGFQEFSSGILFHGLFQYFMDQYLNSINP